MSARLASHIVVSALIWRAQAGGAAVYVLQKGDQTAGQIFVRVSLLDGQNLLFAPAFSLSGERKWDAIGPMADTDIEAKIGRELSRDPDMWLIEIEDRQGRSFLD